MERLFFTEIKHNFENITDYLASTVIMVDPTSTTTARTTTKPNSKKSFDWNSDHHKFTTN